MGYDLYIFNAIVGQPKYNGARKSNERPPMITLVTILIAK